MLLLFCLSFNTLGNNRQTYSKTYKTIRVVLVGEMSWKIITPSFTRITQQYTNKAAVYPNK